MNEFIIETAKEQGWLTEEQTQAARQAIAENPDLSILNFFSERAWLGEEHITWLQQTAEAQAGVSVEPQPAMAEVGASPPPHTIEVTEEEAPLPPLTEDLQVSLAPDGALAHLNDYLRISQHYGASDVHVGVNAPPMMRRGGCLQIMWPKAPRLKAEQTERLMMDFINEKQREHLKKQGDLDFCYQVSGMGRFRSSVVRQRNGYDGVFRIIGTKVRSMDELGLPPILKGLTKFHNGLVLITGSVGSGKSTTMAAFIDEINKERHDHIITLEDPIEYVFEIKGCQITQREVHSHTESFAAALRAALREDPDVVMVGEMRDLETISLAISASETGHLVFGTLHTSSAARTLDRVLDVFPTAQQAQIRTMVAGSLRGIVSQQLIPRADGQGRCLALEVLINSPAAAALIRDGKTYMLPGVMQTGKKIGCKLMDDALMDLLNDEKITPQEAFDRCEQKALFKQYLPTE